MRAPTRAASAVAASVSWGSDQSWVLDNGFAPNVIIAADLVAQGRKGVSAISPERLIDVSVASGVLLQPTAALQPVTALTHGRYVKVKPTLDMILAVVLVIAAAPLMLMITFAIRMDSPGPALFRQQRIGKEGKVFTIYKFRTMVRHAPSYSLKVPVTDSRITRVGRWLRRTGLDELPQLWNVILGDMSLIGPRPEQPFIVEGYEEWQHLRHAIRPGITGWWQVRHRNEVPMHMNLADDIYYLENLSLRLDWYIVRQTMRIIFSSAIPILSPRQ